MQMSRERFQEVHKLIWNMVIARAIDVKKGKLSVRILKRIGINMAVVGGLLDVDEAVMLEHHNWCLLCAAYGDCKYCPLGECRTIKSLYHRAVIGDKEAMFEIRDIVDKEPFTEFSTITLHE